MHRKYPSKRPRRLRTPGFKLFSYLMDRGGSATLTEIARHTADGQLYAKAKPELDGLIGLEECRSARSRRSCKRVYLTVKGYAVAIALRPFWEPRRLATDVLKAWLAELQEEHDPWAVQFVKDADDAAELRRLRAIGWIRPPLKKPGPQKGTRNAGAFKPAERQPVIHPTVTPAPFVRPEFPPSPPPSDYEIYIKAAYGNGPVGRREPAPDARLELVERAKIAGYPTRRTLPGEFQAMFNSEWVDIQEWERLTKP